MTIYRNELPQKWEYKLLENLKTLQNVYVYTVKT